MKMPTNLLLKQLTRIGQHHLYWQMQLIMRIRCNREKSPHHQILYFTPRSRLKRKRKRSTRIRSLRQNHPQRNLPTGWKNIRKSVQIKSVKHFLKEAVNMVDNVSEFTRLKNRLITPKLLNRKLNRK